MNYISETEMLNYISQEKEAYKIINGTDIIEYRETLQNVLIKNINKSSSSMNK